MSDRSESGSAGSYAGATRIRSEVYNAGQTRTRFIRTEPAVNDSTAVIQRISQVNLHEDDADDLDDGRLDSQPVYGKSRPSYATPSRPDKQHAIVTNNSFGGVLRNGAAHGVGEVDSTLRSGHSAYVGRLQSQTYDLPMRIRSRDTPRQRESEVAQTAGTNAPPGFDGWSQRSAYDSGLARAAWSAAPDGNSQSQSLGSGGNSQSATNANGPVNAPPGLVPLGGPGGSQSSKSGVPIILQKHASAKISSTTSGNGNRPALAEQSNESVSTANTKPIRGELNVKSPVSSDVSVSQVASEKPLYSTATTGRPVESPAQPQQQPAKGTNSATKQLIVANGSKLQNAQDSKQQATSPTSTSESVAQEALANLRAFDKKRAKMRFSVSIADEVFAWNATSACDALTDNTDYLVVGVCGLHASGKSTIASLLADPANLRVPADRLPFAVEKSLNLKVASATTIGVDMLVTSERTILLDTQPLLSFALVDAFEADPARRISFPYEQFVDEQSVKLLAFLFSVCHLVVVVLDSAHGESEARLVDLAKLIQFADLVRPSIELINATPSAITNADDANSLQKVGRNPVVRRVKEPPPPTSANDQFTVPCGRDTLSNVHLAFVENKLPNGAFVKRHADRMRAAIDHCFDEQLSSTLTVRSGTVSMLYCALTPGFDGEPGAPANNVNYFALPRFETNENDQSSGGFRIPNFETFLRTLRKQVLSAPIREPIAMLAGANGTQPTPLTEKKWFEYASRCCNAIRNIRMPNFPEEFSQFVLGLGGPT